MTIIYESSETWTQKKKRFQNMNITPFDYRKWRTINTYLCTIYLLLMAYVVLQLNKLWNAYIYS